MLANPTVIAAVVSATAAVLGALLADRVKGAIARRDVISRAMISQVDGWDKWTAHLMHRVSDLEDEVRRKDEDCDRKLSALDAEMKRRDNECKSRIVELEKRIGGAGL